VNPPSQVNIAQGRASSYRVAMKFPWRIGIPIVITVAALAIFLLPREPVYQGKPISYWFAALPEVGIGVDDTRRESAWVCDRTSRRNRNCSRGELEAVMALRAIGTNSLPFILRQFECSSVTFPFNHPKLIGAAQHLARFDKWIEKTQTERAKAHGRAVTALLAIDSLPREAIAAMKEWELTAETVPGFADRKTWHAPNVGHHYKEYKAVFEILIIRSHPSLPSFPSVKPQDSHPRGESSV